MGQVFRYVCKLLCRTKALLMAAIKTELVFSTLESKTGVWEQLQLLLNSVYIYICRGNHHNTLVPNLFFWGWQDRDAGQTLNNMNIK